MIRYDDVYQIGCISKTHALRGEVVMHITDDIFDRTDSDYVIVEVDGILVPFFIEEYRFRSDSSVLMKFDDIDTADQAQRLVGCRVYFEKSKAAESGEDELSLNYFIGFQMLDENGTPIGTVQDIDDHTENWLFIVTRPDGKEVLIPAHEELITDINHEAKTLTMSLPEGLLELV
ncbi:MAG: ribosome maturation factor RimM [Bacteroidaceae bacterium]|nr:ribosome maturation factor RimM [Bacteroidaceae bacterium]MDO4994098.1 ribosome maturation factor RimM [Bacteroidales bacterium]